MTTLARTYVTLRSLIKWLLPAMSAVAAWPLVWLGLQSGGGTVYLIFFLLLMTVGPLVLQGEARVKNQAGWRASALHCGAFLLQCLTVLLFFLFSLQCLNSLIFFGDSAPPGFLSEGALLGAHTFIYVAALWGFRRRGVLDFLSLIAWLFLVILATSLMIYNFQLPVFPQAFQSYVYPRWDGFHPSDFLLIFGLSVFSLGVGWGFRQGPSRSYATRSYHYGLWVFFWSLVVGLLTVPYVFKLNFATSSFETLLSHLPMVFPHLPAGYFAGKTLLLIFYVGSFFVSLLLLTGREPRKSSRSIKILTGIFVVACGFWMWGAKFHMDLYFRFLVTAAYPGYSVLVMIMWLIKSKSAKAGKWAPLRN